MQRRPVPAVAGEERGPVSLQQQIDRAATFHLLVSPRGGRVSCLRQNGRAVGLEGTQATYRLGLTLDMPSRIGVTGANVVGEQVGELGLRWLVVDRDFVAAPGRDPAPIPLDREQSQRFVMSEGTLRFGSGDAFRSFGTGRTYPMSDDRGRPVLAVAAIGELLEGAGAFRNRSGNYTLIGELTAEGAFTGHVMVRVLDFEETLRDDAIPPAVPAGPPEEGVTYLTWIAQKGTDQENYFSISPSGQPRGLNIPVHLKRVWTDFSADASFRGTRLATGEIIGLEIGFGREARPRAPGMGTPQTPFQFEGVSRYSFYGPDGRTVGTITANVLEGRSIGVRLPGAPDQPALRFGYFGPIVCGTGCFSDLRGVLYGTAGSVFAPPPAPHVISNLYVARLFDSAGRWKSARPSTAGAAGRSGRPRPSPDPAYEPLLELNDRLTPLYARWRSQMRACADRFATLIADAFNVRRRVGEFAARAIDVEALCRILEDGDLGPFDQPTFDRYAGRAAGTFRTYRLDSLEEVRADPIVSYWDPANFTRADGRIYKQIRGSSKSYAPGELPALSDTAVDLDLNSWRADVGVTNVDRYDHRRRFRTSIAYKLPGACENIWFVKDLGLDGRETNGTTFLISHEWKETGEGGVFYPLVALYFDIDFDRGRIAVHGETFWRLRYREG
jgi:hypothetical protein